MNRDWLARQARRLVFFAALLAAWELLSRFGPWPPYLLPGPAEVARSLGAGLVDGSIERSVAISLRRLVTGFLLSVLLGAVIGVVNARSRTARETLGLLVLGLQALPSICWMPLALVWFGLSEASVLFVVVMGSLLSIAIAVEDAVRNIPPITLRAARNLGARGVPYYRDVVVPAALPTVVSGFKQGWSFAWRALMAGELLFVGPGLGRLLMIGRDLNDMARVIAVMVVIVVMGLVVDRLAFAPVERRLRRVWG